MILKSVRILFDFSSHITSVLMCLIVAEYLLRYVGHYYFIYTSFHKRPTKVCTKYELNNAEILWPWKEVHLDIRFSHFIAYIRVWRNRIYIDTYDFQHLCTVIFSKPFCHIKLRIVSKMRRGADMGYLLFM